jgi:hypothetical protein
MARLEISADELPEPMSAGPVPAGEYLCEIVDSEVTQTEKSQGRRVLLTFLIVDGPYAGSRIWERADIDRVSISKRDGSELRIDAARFNGLLKALGMGPLRDSQELHSRPVLVRVAVEERADYNPRNVVKGYRPAPVQATHAPPQARQTAPSRPAAAPAQPTPGGRPIPAYMQNRR